jgi:hypothetical protein
MSFSKEQELSKPVLANSKLEKFFVQKWSDKSKEI